MPDEKQNPATDADDQKQDTPVEMEESGAGYGNNAGDQGTQRD